MPGGILIENSFRGAEWMFAIAGIGININQTVFDPSLPNPVSLKQITGRQFNVVQLARELCAMLEMRFRQLQTSGKEAILDEYELAMYKRGQVVKLRQGGIFEAIIEGVSPSGKLIASGSQFGFNEVEWVIG